MNFSASASSPQRAKGLTEAERCASASPAVSLSRRVVPCSSMRRQKSPHFFGPSSLSGQLRPTRGGQLFFIFNPPEAGFDLVPSVIAIARLMPAPVRQQPLSQRRPGKYGRAYFPRSSAAESPGFVRHSALGWYRGISSASEIAELYGSRAIRPEGAFTRGVRARVKAAIEGPARRRKKRAPALPTVSETNRLAVEPHRDRRRARPHA